jgi:hypothetical protein
MVDLAIHDPTTLLQSGADYLLLTDYDVSITDMWGTERILFSNTSIHEVLFKCHLQ